MSIHSIQQYQNEVEKIIHFGGTKKETAIRNAFYNLLNEYAKQKGLMVVISCRKFFQGINDCMAEHNSEEAWQKYKVEHEAEIEKKSKVGGLSKSSDPRPVSR